MPFKTLIDKICFLILLRHPHAMQRWINHHHKTEQQHKFESAYSIQSQIGMYSRLSLFFFFTKHFTTCSECFQINSFFKSNYCVMGKVWSSLPNNKVFQSIHKMNFLFFLILHCCWIYARFIIKIDFHSFLVFSPHKKEFMWKNNKEKCGAWAAYRFITVLFPSLFNIY